MDATECIDNRVTTDRTTRVSLRSDRAAIGSILVIYCESFQRNIVRCEPNGCTAGITTLQRRICGRYHRYARRWNNDRTISTSRYVYRIVRTRSVDSRLQAIASLHVNRVVSVILHAIRCVVTSGRQSERVVVHQAHRSNTRYASTQADRFDAGAERVARNNQIRHPFRASDTVAHRVSKRVAGDRQACRTTIEVALYTSISVDNRVTTDRTTRVSLRSDRAAIGSILVIYCESFQRNIVRCEPNGCTAGITTLQRRICGRYHRYARRWNNDRTISTSRYVYRIVRTRSVDSRLQAIASLHVNRVVSVILHAIRCVVTSGRQSERVVVHQAHRSNTRYASTQADRFDAGAERVARNNQIRHPFRASDTVAHRVSKRVAGDRQACRTTIEVALYTSISVDNRVTTDRTTREALWSNRAATGSVAVVDRKACIGSTESDSVRSKANACAVGRINSSNKCRRGSFKRLNRYIGFVDIQSFSVGSRVDQDSVVCRSCIDR